MLTSFGVGFYSYMWFKVFADTRKERRRMKSTFFVYVT